MVIHTRRKDLFQGRALTEKQEKNAELNLAELNAGTTFLHSVPRRLVLELTNACNLNCRMCGRNAADFKPTVFDPSWLYSLETIMESIEEVTLLGWGEPTIHPAFVDMMQFIHAHKARIYFCTNGMRLKELFNPIFENEVEVFTVSVDGAKPETNNHIRRGSDLEYITSWLKKIKQRKKSLNLRYPYVNFSFCAMKQNLNELPDLIRLAADIGLEEVKTVYLTAFNEAMACETLWDCQKEVEEVFQKAAKLGDELGVKVKLPYIQGSDPAGTAPHSDCYSAWRDFFLGSDGFVRPCMSTELQFFRFDPHVPFQEIWNHEKFCQFRAAVNTPNKMESSCERCYHSSYCNRNQKHAFFQLNNYFSPSWNGLDSADLGFKPAGGMQG